MKFIFVRKLYITKLLVTWNIKVIFSIVKGYAYHEFITLYLLWSYI